MVLESLKVLFDSSVPRVVKRSWRFSQGFLKKALDILEKVLVLENNPGLVGSKKCPLIVFQCFSGLLEQVPGVLEELLFIRILGVFLILKEFPGVLGNVPGVVEEGVGVQ